MPYITNTDIEERLGHAAYVQLTDDTNSGIADEDKINEARLSAEGEVDSYLSRRCAVPVDVTTHPELAGVLLGVTLDLAEYRLFVRRSPAPDEIKAKRDAAVRWLQRIASGEAVLPCLSELPANTTAGITGQAIGARRTLTRTEIRDL